MRKTLLLLLLPTLLQAQTLVKTLAELKARKGTDDGYVMLRGTTALNVKPRLYFWDVTSTATANDSTVVQVTGVSTGRYVAMVQPNLVVTQGSSTNPSSTSASSFTVTNMTSTGVQNAIDAGYQNIVVKGVYDFSMGQVLIQRKVAITGINTGNVKATFDGKTSNHVLIKMNNADGDIISNVKFSSNDTGNLYGLLLINEEGPVTNLIVQHCEFTCPNGDINAISAQAWNGSSGTYHSDWLFWDNDGHDIGRMFLEFQSHKYDRDFRIINVVVLGNKAVNTGTVNKTDAMTYSFTGDLKNIKLIDNIGLEFRGHGAEFIGTNGFEALNNIFRSTKRWGGGDGNQYGSNGYNLTDGYNAEQGNNPGQQATNGTISGGEVEVSGRPVQANQATNISFSNVSLKGFDNILLQHTNGIKFSNCTIRSQNYVGIFFDDSKNGEIMGGSIITTNSQTIYEFVGFYYGSTGNKVYGVNLWGNPQNGSIVKENDNTGTNKWDVVVNGTQRNSQL